MDVVKIGTFIKTQRTELNMTQKDLAKKIGCTDKAISRWETGKGLPDMSFIIPLSKELNVSINELLIGEKLITNAVTPEETEMVTEIVKRNDKTLAEVIEESQKTIKRHAKVSLILFVLLCLQLLIFSVVPEFIPGHEEPILVVMYLSATISVIVGFLKTKLKWLFPIIIVLIYLIIYLFEYTGEAFDGFAASVYFAVGSIILIAISSLISYLYQKIKNR